MSVGDALAAFDQARRRLVSQTGVRGQEAERQYVLAYGRLVKLGVRPRLRRKYRVN